MVLLTRAVLDAVRFQVPKRIRRKFVDSMRLLVRGGSGGMGSPKYGGVGGTGGNVIAVGKEGITLRDVIQQHRSKRVIAQHGQDSYKRKVLGTNGEDVTIETPIGITLYDDTGRVIGEIDEDGKSAIVAKGGVGGCRETGYCGLKGESFVLTLDLKLIADVGLVGFPNAGKSTILSVLSNARPKISSYPFTTIQPNIGILEYKDLRQISMADLPGLIEGAAYNIGMGHKFLKHVERTKLLVLVVDVGGFQLSPLHPARSALETIVLLNKELELYREDLIDKPCLLIVNKMDKKGTDSIYHEILDATKHYSDVLESVPESIRPHRQITFEQVIPMQAKKKLPEEIEKVKAAIRECLDMEFENENVVDEASLETKYDSKRQEAGAKLL